MANTTDKDEVTSSNLVGPIEEITGKYGEWAKNANTPKTPKERLTKTASGVRSGVVELPPAAIEYRPESVVYFLVRRGGRVVYIGQSCRLSRRLADHRKRKRGFSKVYVVHVPPGLREEIESVLIATYTPELNQTEDGRYGIRQFSYQAYSYVLTHIFGGEADRLPSMTTLVERFPVGAYMRTSPAPASAGGAQ